MSTTALNHNRQSPLPWSFANRLLECQGHFFTWWVLNGHVVRFIGRQVICLTVSVRSFANVIRFRFSEVEPAHQTLFTRLDAANLRQVLLARICIYRVLRQQLSVLKSLSDLVFIFSQETLLRCFWNEATAASLDQYSLLH